MPKYTAGEYRVIMSANAKPAIDDLKKVKKEITGTKFSFGNMFKSMKLGWIAAGAVGVKALKMIGGYIKSSIQAAIKYGETVNKFNITFREVSLEAKVMARNLRNAYGLSNQEAKELLSNTGDLLAGFGLSGKAALDLSGKVQRLAVDLASFTNIEGGASRASEALTKAMLGERESMKALGVVISETAINQKLLKRGQEKLTGNALLQAKAYATLEIATEQSKNAIGDFARSQDSAANMFKTIKARGKDAAVELGNSFMPAVVAVLKLTLDLTDNQKEVDSTTRSLIDAYTDYSDAVSKLENNINDLNETEKLTLENRRDLAKLEGMKMLLELDSGFMTSKEMFEKQRSSAEGYRANLQLLNWQLESLIKQQKKAGQFTGVVTKAGEAFIYPDMMVDIKVQKETIKDLVNEQIQEQKELNEIIDSQNKKVNFLAELYLKNKEAIDFEVLGNKELIKLIKERANELDKNNKLEKSLIPIEFEIKKPQKNDVNERIKEMQEAIDQSEDLEIEVKLKKLADTREVVDNVSEEFAAGIVNALSSGDPQQAAEGVADTIGDTAGNIVEGVLEKAGKGAFGWIGGLIAEAIKLFKTLTGSMFNELVNDLSKMLEPLIANIVENIITTLTNPSGIVRIVISLVKGIIQGIFQAFRTLFTADFWTSLWEDVSDTSVFKKEIKEVKLKVSKVEMPNIKLDVKINDEEVKKDIEKFVNKHSSEKELLTLNFDKTIQGLNDLNEEFNTFKDNLDSTEKIYSDFQTEFFSEKMGKILNKENLKNVANDAKEEFDNLKKEWSEFTDFTYEIGMGWGDLSSQQWSSLWDEDPFIFSNNKHKKEVREMAKELNELYRKFEDADKMYIEAQYKYNEWLKDKTSEQSKLASAVETAKEKFEQGTAEYQKYLDIVVESQIKQIEHAKTMNINGENNIAWLKKEISLYESLLNNADILGLSLAEQWNFKEKLIKLEKEHLSETLDEITATDKFLKLQKEAGLFLGTELEYNKKILELLQGQLKEIEKLANIENLDLNELDEYWEILIETNKLEEKNFELQQQQTEEIQKQTDSLQSQYDLKLSAEEKIKKAQLEASGLSRRQIEKQMQAFRVEQFQERKILASIDGTSLSEMGNLSSIFSGLVGNLNSFRISSELADIGKFIKNYQPSNTITNIDIRSLAEGINTGKISRDELATMVEDLKEEIGSI